MFKNLTIFRIVGTPTVMTTAQREETLEIGAFVTCSASQVQSTGWVPPRETHGPLMETVLGTTSHILKLMTETKVVPASVVKRKVEEQASNIEATTGRKPGKKELREIKENAFLSLLPMAFTKQHATLIWIDPSNNLLIICESSQSKIDLAVTALIRYFDGLALQLVSTQQSPSSAMAQWLVEQTPPTCFSVDRECELKACDESKAVVKYGRHALDIEEVSQHIRLGKMPTKLALTWHGRVSFVLTDAFKLKKLSFLDVVFEDSASKANPHVDSFDADLAIFTGELSVLIYDLINALGGEVAA